MRYLLLIAIVLPLLACESKIKTTTNTLSDAEYTVAILDTLWFSDPIFKTPESVLFDSIRDILYVSNINENPWDMDNNGFISTMNKDGKVQDLLWVAGLSGPKGMALKDNKLYIADISYLVEIDIEKRKIINQIPVKAANVQLNDVTVSQDGRVFVSGSGSGKIYELIDGKLVLYHFEEDSRPNGLLTDKNKLLFVTSKTKQFKSIHLTTKEIAEEAIDSIGGGDGLIKVGENQYIISNWAGRIVYVNEKDMTFELLNSIDKKINMADIDHIPASQTLYVPTFFDNRIMAFKYNIITVLDPELL